MLTMITGGVKSGKSGRALDIARNFTPPVHFIATSVVFDDEMKNRVEKHKIGREETGTEFITIEEPLALDNALRGIRHSLVIDCIPMWVNNIIYYKRENELDGILERSIQYIKDNIKNCVIVTNETGLGNIPFDETTRRYNLLLSGVNKKIAAAADIVEFMVSGIPLKIKEPLH